MAAEKRNQSGTQSIVDQDAAITAYLDGLLRDPEQEEGAESARGRKAPGLTVINRLEMTGVAEAAAEPAVETERDDVSAAGEVLADEPEAAVEAEAMAAESVEAAGEQSPAMVDEGPAEPEEAAAPSEAEAVAEPEPSQASDAPAMERADEIAPEPAEMKVDESTGQPEAEPPAEQAETSPWAWLRVGGMILAIPAEEVVAHHSDAALDPVPGAPAQVAGSLSVDDRPRLILSLPAVTGARPHGAATEVLLLGKGGLWGVVGEPVAEPVAFDEETVQWRSEAQKAERRGWLSGTVPAAGVAVLDVAGLRAALKGSR